MFKLNKKTLNYFTVFAAVLLFAALIFPPSRTILLNTLKEPLSIFSLIRREIGGIVFYHRNYIQNEKIKKEAELLKSELNQQRELFLENARLRNLFSFKEASKYQLIAAKVVARLADSWGAGVIINKGSRSGIKKGMSVITHLGLAGRVVETTGFTSKVMLITDPSLGVSALVQRSRQEGLVSGTLGAHLTMKYLPEGADIKANDEIVTSGLNETYPKGLLIGKVLEVGKEFSGLSLYAIIKPAVNLLSLEEVLIILS